MTVAPTGEPGLATTATAAHAVCSTSFLLQRTVLVIHSFSISLLVSAPSIASCTTRGGAAMPPTPSEPLR